jgi:hypothetical protein
MILIFLLIFINYQEKETPTIENICGTMYPRTGSKDWGDGGYIIPKNFEVSLFSDTVGTKVGKLKTVDGYLSLFDKADKQVNYNYYLWDIEYIGHPSLQVLKIKSVSNSNYVKCFWNNFPEGRFFDKSEIEKTAAKYYTYQDLICNTKLKLNEYDPPYGKIGVNLVASCLNIRTGPSIRFPVITCVHGNDINSQGESHMTIIESKGPWAKVEVITERIDNSITEEVEDGPCPSILVKRNIGWLRAVDKNGFPNIWYSISGY